MKASITLIAIGILLPTIAFGQVRSQYTTFDAQKDCTVIGQAAEGDGDWADLVCSGYGHYPFVIRYGDARETITYGFASQPGMDGFIPFNNAGGTIEWRVREDRGASYPFAAIQRWFVARPEGEGKDREVLVVSRVGQPSDGGGCVIAYVLASGDPAANEKAREIADQRAADFKCWMDRPEIAREASDMVVQP
jgi:hypothetical protein